MPSLVVTVMRLVINSASGQCSENAPSFNIAPFNNILLSTLTP